MTQPGEIVQGPRMVVGYPSFDQSQLTTEPRMDCWRCGKSVAVMRDGHLRRHGHFIRDDGIRRKAPCEGTEKRVLCWLGS